MASNFTYSADGKTLTATSLSGLDVVVPVEVLDFLGTIHVNQSFMEEMQAYRALTILENGLPVSEPVIVSASSLIGVDLSNKIVRVMYANYEDSEWFETEEALTVRDVGDGYCAFDFGKHYEDVYNNPDSTEEVPYGVMMLSNFVFSFTTEIWVADKNPV